MHVDGTVCTHRLDDGKTQCQTAAYDHLGETDMDRLSATRAGCGVLQAAVAPCQPWGPQRCFSRVLSLWKKGGVREPPR